MALNNATTVIGTLADDPDLRSSHSGAKTAYFTLIWKRSRKNYEDEISYLRVVALGRMGENVAESLRKGDTAIVFGAVQERRWQTETGESRSKMEILADHVGPSLRWATASPVRNPPDRGDTYHAYG